MTTTERREGLRADQRYFLAYDAGGTMTDCVVVDSNGDVGLGKALTNYADEATSFLESTADAAGYARLDLDELFGSGEAVIYAGTIMLNTILSYSGQRVGLLVSRGMEDYLTQQRAEGSWLGLAYADRLHSVTHYNKKPYVPRQRVLGVQERVDLTGAPVIPMRDEEVRRHVATLVDLGSEVIGVCFMFSSLNPVHERRAKEVAREVLDERGVEIPVVISSELAPTLKEYTRLTSVVLQTYAAEPSRIQFKRVEEAAQKHGFRHDVHTLLSHGGVASINHPRLYEAFVNGPVGGILGARFVGEMLGVDNLVCTDVGGTSFDVGIIRGGLVPVEREPVVLHNRISLPMIHTVSIGAGTGSELKINPVSRRLNIGPRSAGPDTGLCYRHPLPTVTDVDVALGYLNPDYFLGGNVPLDPERALMGVKQLAAEFGQDPYAFAAGVLDVFHESMRQHLVSMVQGRGYDTGEYTLAAYGGGGPMHLWGYERGMGFDSVVTFPFAAVFSAFGILTTDRIYRYHQATVAAVPPGDDPVTQGIRQAAMEALNAGFAGLRERALNDLVRSGVSEKDVTFQHYAYVRYATQIYDFEVPLPFGQLESLDDVDRLVAEFERVYATLYPKAGRYPEAGYLILEVAVTASIATPRPVLPEFPLQSENPVDESKKPSRQGYWEGDWLPFQVYDMDHLHAGNIVTGPAVLEDPATTLVVPPDRRARFDEHRFIWLEEK